MKKLFFCGVMMVLCSLPMSAQKVRQRLSPEEMVNRKVEQLDKKLELTDSQEVEIRKLYAGFYSQQIKREDRKAKQEALDKSIEALLNDSQKTAFAELKKQLQSRKKRK